MSDLYAQAALDLQNQVAAPITAGDAYLTAGTYDKAVQAYQAAGVASLSIGPEIDAAGQSVATQPFTHQAWYLNASLAAINSSPNPPGNGIAAVQGDATLAQNLAKQMLSLYQSAIDAGRSAAGWGAGTVALVALAITAAAAGGGYFLYKKYGHRIPPMTAHPWNPFLPKTAENPRLEQTHYVENYRGQKIFVTWEQNTATGRSGWTAEIMGVHQAFRRTTYEEAVTQAQKYIDQNMVTTNPRRRYRALRRAA